MIDVKPGWLTRAAGNRKRAAVIAGGVAVAVVAGVVAIGGWMSAGTGRRFDRTTGVGCDAQIDRALRAWAEQGFAGSVAVRGGERECVAGYGMADRASGRENTPETVFSLESVTKAVTAAAIFNLIDQGVLSLDDTAGRHVAGLTGAIADVALRDLLLHTSGLNGAHGHDHEPLSEAEAIESISALDVAFEPGSQWLYNNANYTLLALVIESVTGGYRQYLSTSILINGDGEPIGGFWDGEPAAPGPRAVGHLDDGPGEAGDFAGPHWALDGNGGVAMTASELAEWTRALFSGEILSTQAVDMLRSTTSRLAADEAVELPGWGLIDMPVVGEPVITTSGGGGAIGHTMDVAWLPESERVVVIAQNAGSRATNSLGADILVPLVVGTGVPGPPEFSEPDPATVTTLVGTYRLEGGGRLHVTQDGPGFEVAAEGADAMAALFLPTPGLEAEIERHERQALAFVDGATPEGQRERRRLEAEHGPILDVELVGSISSGELVTIVKLHFTGSDLLLALALNRYGGTEAVGPVTSPAAWFVLNGAGGITGHGVAPDQPQVTLAPAEGGLTITGPGGVMFAERES